ncbi:MAG: PrsW family glutamic-type intramembrane protease [Candidatus Liptonbacteria bacterium]
MTIVLPCVLALLPGFIWLIFYLSEDSHQEPKVLVALTFISGVASAFVALLIQYLLNKSGLTGSPIQLGSGEGLALRFILSLLIFSMVEELVKFGAAYLVISKSKEFNQPIDAMVYLVIAALGFATVENFGATFMGKTLPPLPVIIETLALRFIGATLLHTLSSGLLGYYWAMSIRHFKTVSLLLFGIVAATLLHAGFNYLIIRHENIFYWLAFVVLGGFLTLNDFEKLKQKAI